MGHLVYHFKDLQNWDFLEHSNGQIHDIGCHWDVFHQFHAKRKNLGGSWILTDTKFMECTCCMTWKKNLGATLWKKNTFFHFFGPIGQTPEIFLSGLILFWPTKTMIKIFVSLRICILESITYYCEQLESFSWSIVEDLSFPKWCILHLKWSSEEQITKLNIFSQFWLFFLCFKNWTFSLL